MMYWRERKVIENFVKWADKNGKIALYDLDLVQLFMDDIYGPNYERICLMDELLQSIGYRQGIWEGRGNEKMVKRMAIRWLNVNAAKNKLIREDDK